MESLYKAISDKTGRRFAKVEDGQIIHLGKPHEPIPDNHLSKYTNLDKLDNGFYSLSLSNCGSPDCHVAKPNPKCVESGIYSEGKCATYSVNSANVSVDLDDVVDSMMALMDELK